MGRAMLAQSGNRVRACKLPAPSRLSHPTPEPHKLPPPPERGGDGPQYHDKTMCGRSRRARAPPLLPRAGRVGVGGAPTARRWKKKRPWAGADAPSPLRCAARVLQESRRPSARRGPARAPPQAVGATTTLRQTPQSILSASGGTRRSVRQYGQVTWWTRGGAGGRER